MSTEGCASLTPIAVDIPLATLLRACILQAAEEAKKITPCQSIADMRSRVFAVQLTYAGQHHRKSGVILVRPRGRDHTE